MARVSVNDTSSSSCQTKRPALEQTRTVGVSRRRSSSTVARAIIDPLAPEIPTTTGFIATPGKVVARCVVARCIEWCFAVRPIQTPYTTRARMVKPRCNMDTPLLYLKKGAFSLDRSSGFRKPLSKTNRLTAKAHPM